jgi:hypothetical protein
VRKKVKKLLGPLVLTSVPEVKKAQPVSNVSENIKISRRTRKGPPNFEEAIRAIRGKKPSKDLIRQIEEFGHSCGNPKNLKQKIRKKGIEEGFSDLEINLLAREVLRDRLSRRQLNYWFSLKRSWKKSSSHNSQFVKNNSEKHIEKSQVAVTSEPVEGIVIIPLQSPEEGQQEESPSSDLYSTAPTAIKTHRENPNHIFTFFNLSDPNTIDCTNHPMYRRAQKKIEQLKQVLLGKDDLIKQLKIEVESGKRNGTSLENIESNAEGEAVAEAAAGDIP